MFDVKLKPNSKVEFEFDENHNTGLLVIEGKIKINNSEVVEKDKFVLLKNAGTFIEIESFENAVVLIMSGEPINVPIVQYGPFLMNTNAEIEQAFADFRTGEIGILEE